MPSAYFDEAIDHEETRNSQTVYSTDRHSGLWRGGTRPAHGYSCPNRGKASRERKTGLKTFPQFGHTLGLNELADFTTKFD